MTVVVAGVIESGGRILICRRRPDHPHPLKWEFPGGKVEAGETPRAALVRELEEELGIQAKPDGEIARYSFAYPGKSPILLIFYGIKDFAGEPLNLVFDTIAWVERAALPSYDFLEGDIEFVRRLAVG